MWNELGIEPTSDPKVVRRAYAQRLRSLDPDKDIAAFQRLRAAFEWALRAAERKGNAAAPPQPPSSPPRREEIAEPAVTFSPAPAVIAELVPEPLNETRELVGRINAALQENRYTDAFALRDRGLAQGLFPIGARDRIIERIMAGVVADKALDSATFRTFMRQSDWDTLPGRREFVSPVRAKAYDRLQAETWFDRLRALAEGRPAPPSARVAAKLTGLQRAIKWNIERRNARVFFGHYQFWRMTNAGADDLRRKVSEFRHYGEWLDSRVDPKCLARAERIVRRHADWGPTVNVLLGASGFLIFIIFMLAAAFPAGGAGIGIILVLTLRLARAGYARMMARIQHAG